MKRNEKVVDLRKVMNDLETKKTNYFNHRFTKYVVDYTVCGDNLKVVNNIGRYKMIKNTRSNMKKLNQTIVKNKIEIANKIDGFESRSKERLNVFIVNAIFLGTSGMLVPFTMFIGSYALFLCSILLFSVCVLETTMIGFNYYVEIREIQNLKKITGYKKEAEFKLPHIDMSALKSR